MKYKVIFYQKVENQFILKLSQTVSLIFTYVNEVKITTEGPELIVKGVLPNDCTEPYIWVMKLSQKISKTKKDNKQEKYDIINNVKVNN